MLSKVFSYRIRLPGNSDEVKWLFEAGNEMLACVSEKGVKVSRKKQDTLLLSSHPHLI